LHPYPGPHAESYVSTSLIYLPLCQAIAETAERERRWSGLAAEVAQLADDPVDRVERGRLMAEMDAIAPEWPE
jgi:hypothetical protein